MSATESPQEIADRLQAEREAEQAPRARPFPVAVTGGRDHHPSQAELARFWTLFDQLGATELHHGAQRGVDLDVAADVRRRRPNVPIVPHPVSPEEWREIGPKAGPLRNRAMMTQARALIAFPGGKGTRSCIREALRQGKPVHYIAAQPVPEPITTRPTAVAPTPARRRWCPPGQHDPDRFRYFPPDATWWAHCRRCGSSYEVDDLTAAKLEWEIDRHLKAGRTTTDP